MHRLLSELAAQGVAVLMISSELPEVLGMADRIVVLERGRGAEKWRSQRWDSFTLLSPNWQTRLPGHAYFGPDPDGFMTGAETAEFLAGYARSFAAPVLTVRCDGRPLGGPYADEQAMRAALAAAPWVTVAVTVRL